MIRQALPLLLLLASMLAGCLAPESGTQLVPDDPFGVAPAPAGVRQAAYSPSAQPTGGPRPAVSVYSNGYAPAQSVQAAARVDSLGRQIIGANPDAGLRPMFVAIGGTPPEIFHVETSKVFITEGLIAKCKTDGQLAAMLCAELGQMVAEREAKADPQTRAPERLPPMEVPIGNDGFGSMGSADQTHLAELAKFQRERRRPATAPAPLPPDPRVLANRYLTKAGFAASDLDSVAPLLTEAGQHNTFEKQFTAPGPARPWTQ
jgi:hypothetical protein